MSRKCETQRLWERQLAVEAGSNEIASKRLDTGELQGLHPQLNGCVDVDLFVIEKESLVGTRAELLEGVEIDLGIGFTPGHILGGEDERESVGQTVTISGVGAAGYNGSFVITSVPSPTTFTYTDVAGLGNSGGGTADTLITSIQTALGDLVGQPRTQAQRVRDFLGGQADLEAMIQAVDPALYRNRKPAGGVSGPAGEPRFNHPD